METKTITIPLDVYEKMKRVGDLLRTQDNRITDSPIFIVQEKVRVYGFDSSYSDDSVWLDTDGDYVEATEDETDELELGTLEGDGWQEVYYKDEWRYVTACFTEQGCKDFIAADGHNHGELRIYADGSHRNQEFRDVREFLMLLSEIDDREKKDSIEDGRHPSYA